MALQRRLLGDRPLTSGDARRMVDALAACYHAISEAEVCGQTAEATRLMKVAMDLTHPIMYEAGYV